MKLSITPKFCLRSRRLKSMTIAALLTTCISCEDFVKVDPPRNQLITKTVYSNDKTATSALTGIYNEMMNKSGFASSGPESIALLAGLSADEFNPHITIEEPFYFNDLNETDDLVKSQLWELGFKYIYYANSVLEGLERSSKITEATKKQLEGEARFIRAFSFFYLTNMFGNVPLVTSTDYEVNRNKVRNSTDQIYEQLIADLLTAKDLLVEDYALFQGNRVRPTKWAASALLARVYLYKNDWPKAEAESSQIIDMSSLFTLENDLDKIFLANSSEAIWQLMPVVPNQNTWEGITYIPDDKINYVSLTNELLTSFEVNDQRKIHWINNIEIEGITHYYPYKYKVRFETNITEYSMVIRLTEIYLIRSEARARLNNLNGAVEDLDLIRSRAELPLVKNTSPTIIMQDLLNVIWNERKIELFSEWGHRWFDLKRTNMSNSILAPLKGSDWQGDDTLYPVPQSEIQNSPSLLPQNPGY